jgi:hypothetical protein
MPHPEGEGSLSFISFSPGFNRVTEVPLDLPTVSTVSNWIGGTCQYHLRKRGGPCFAEMSPDGLTHPLTQVVLTNQQLLITRLKPGENEREALFRTGTTGPTTIDSRTPMVVSITIIQAAIIFPSQLIQSRVNPNEALPA